jgi:lipoyl-dependent peroxiredoxin subunit D
MSIEVLSEQIPEYAKDLKLNLSSLFRQTGITEQQLWGTAAASAMACGNADVVREVISEAATHLSPEALRAAKAAAAIMGMNNVYYRFTHLTKNPKYGTIPARLRMNIIRAHGVDQIDFELWCTAVSAINGCGACVDSHETVIREKGVTEETVAASVRLASVIHAISAVLTAEAALRHQEAAAV